MAIGYSVIHLARGMGERGLVVTIEPSEEMITAASAYLDRANLMNQVKIERGKALDVMPGIEDDFDLLYIDAVKEEYKQYLDLGNSNVEARWSDYRRQSSVGWQGGSEDVSNNNDASTVALREFNSYFIESSTIVG